MLRSKGELLNINNFKGVVDIIDGDKLDEGYCEYAIGLFFSADGEAVRIGGKKAFSKLIEYGNNFLGRVLNLTHLVFKDRDFLLVHCGRAYLKEDDLSILRLGGSGVNLEGEFIDR